MHNYALSNPKYKSAAFMLIADDDQRDHASREKALTLGQQWREAGYHVISMRDDFKTIYGEGVTKTDFSFPIDTKPLTEWQAGRTVSQEAVEAFGRRRPYPRWCVAAYAGQDVQGESLHRT